MAVVSSCAGGGESVVVLPSCGGDGEEVGIVVSLCVETIKDGCVVAQSSPNGDISVRLKAAAFGELDQERRFADYKKIFERIDERAYILPLTTFPSVWVSSNEVEVEKGVLNSIGGETIKMRWR